MDLILYLEAHQPRRLRGIPPLKLGEADDLLDVELDRSLFEKVAERCYRPLLKLVEASENGLKLALKVSGTLLEQMEAWGSDLLESLKSLVSAGRVELVAGPYYHSIASLIAPEELVEQTRMHVDLIDELMGVRPKVFSNPFLIYDDRVGQLVSEELGMSVVIAEGSPRVLGWRAPSYVYKSPASETRLLLRDYRLSDEVSFGLGRGYVRADSYATRVSRIEGQVVVVGLPAETFGEFIPAEAGAFEFLKWLPRELSKYPWVRFSTPSEAASKYEPVDELAVSQPVSWLEGKDLSALTGSPLQVAALEILRELRVKALSSGLARAWRLLSQADLLYSMRASMGVFLKFERAACSLRSSIAARSLTSKA